MTNTTTAFIANAILDGIKLVYTDEAAYTERARLGELFEELSYALQMASDTEHGRGKAKVLGDKATILAEIAERFTSGK